jgi:RNA polymerase sigma-70 factor (ECF subfamily)
MTEPSDEDLVRQCLVGNRDAFGKIIDRYQRPIYNIILRMVRNRDDAADISQIAFIRAYEKLSSFDTNQQFFRWMYRIAVNAALNFIAQKKRTDPLDEAIMEQIPQVDDDTEEDLASDMEIALQKLRPDHRAIIVLKHYQDLSYEEIAAIMDIPAKTVKSRLFTARHLLRTIILRRQE